MSPHPRPLAAWPFLLLLTAGPLLPQATQAPDTSRSMAPAPEPARLEVTFTPRQATIGDRIEAVLTLRVTAKALAGDPRFPVWGTTWGDAEVLEKEAAQRLSDEGGAAVWRQRVVLAGFRTGRIDLPPASVAVPLSDRTIQATTPAGLGFVVASVLPQGEKDPKPKPPAALRPLPLGAPFWWTLAGLSALCGLLGWALWRRARRRVTVETARPALPPLAELSGELDRLAAEPSMLVLHTRLSLALRHYLGRALGVPAPESTTSEVHRRLLARRVPGALVRQTVELLRACDLVKFARQEVAAARGRERLEAARQIAGRLDAHARPVLPETAAETKLEAAG